MYPDWDPRSEKKAIGQKGKKKITYANLNKVWALDNLNKSGKEILEEETMTKALLISTF